MAIGAPALFSSPEAMESKIAEYLEYIKGEKDEDDKYIRMPEPITITGLCLYLGFESRQSFYDYEKRPAFSYIIKRARLQVENSYEKRLSGQNVTGSIFVLKNMGWEDRTQRELSGNLDLSKKPSWFDDVEQKAT